MADDAVVGLDNLDGLPSLDGDSNDGLPSLDAGAPDDLGGLPSLDNGADVLNDGLTNGLPDIGASEEVSAERVSTPQAASTVASPAPSANIGGVAGPSGKVVNIKNIQSIKVRVQAILGGVNMSVSELADLKQNDLIPLDACIGDEVDLWANGVLIGKGEIVVIEAETPRFGITLTKLINSDAANAAE